ncbi:MAG: hypothetical protein P8J87_05020 [Verrucomicrobiales bacterium]|nr:hypothetical protein [Verrucomicrobiales bacterium]
MLAVGVSVEVKGGLAVLVLNRWWGGIGKLGFGREPPRAQKAGKR